MAVETLGATAVHADRPSRRGPAGLFVAGGLLTAAGGMLHPRGSGETVDDYLLSMFDAPAWSLSHCVLLVGTLTTVAAFVTAGRRHAFGSSVQRWLAIAAVGWTLAAVELVPHLLASNDAAALAHHQATPMLDAHLLLQLVSGPAVGLSVALLAVAVARSSRSRAAWALAAFAVVGGIGSGAAGPMVVVTDDPAFSVLFAFQVGVAVWLVGTGVRLLRR